MKKYCLLSLLAAICITSLFAGGSSEAVAKDTQSKTLVVYSNSVSDGRGDWLVERAKEEGFDIQYVDAGGPAISQRLIAEKNSPIADVAFGMHSILWEGLKAQGLLVQYVPSWADEVSEGNDPDGYYHAIVRQGLLLVYDSNQWSEDEAPSDWPDLWTKEQFHKTYEFEQSLTGGTTQNILASILTRYLDDDGYLGVSEEGWQAVKDYYRYGVPDDGSIDLYAKIADPSSTVVCGQMWSSGVEARDQQYGTATKYVVPEVGIPFLSESVGIINGTDNLEEAKRFVDWFGSAEIQAEWAQTFSTLPANENALWAANEFSRTLAEQPAQDVNWAVAAEYMEMWVEEIILNCMP